MNSFFFIFFSFSWSVQFGKQWEQYLFASYKDSRRYFAAVLLTVTVSMGYLSRDMTKATK